MAQEYPLPPTYKTSDPASLAYDSARRRWPVIVTGAIDDMYRSVSQCEDYEDEKRDEGKRITEALSKLKYELQHGRALTPLPDDGASDVAHYNARLEALGSPVWTDVEWLYAECYLYRRIHTLFSMSEYWKKYDVFARQKIKTFRSSRPAVVELATKYKKLILQILDRDEDKPEDLDKERLLFVEMCEICLWGNATDLSLLTNLTYDDIQKLQGSAARKAAEKNIVINDLHKAFDVLHKAKTSGKAVRRVDFVLDNAGFELYVDLVLAGYLLVSGLATEVVLHPKRLPWFVSDVLQSDFRALLDALEEPQPFYETPSDDEKLTGQTPTPLEGPDVVNLRFVYHDWRGLHRDDRIVLRDNDYWTRGSDFRNLPREDQELAADLAKSELVIFKGDLNYRKLTGDAAWDPTTPFGEALGPLGAEAGINILALRTCKADVVVGLEAGADERLKATEDGTDANGARKWGWNGKWAVVSLHEGKTQQQ